MDTGIPFTPEMDPKLAKIKGFKDAEIECNVTLIAGGDGNR